MKLGTFAVLLISGGTLLADPLIENAQQALKDQGFYYGEVSGNKDADTTAAIRRYQIRNGLQITGELNDETIKSLGVSASGNAVVKATPATGENGPAPLKEEPEPQQAQTPTNPLTGQPFPDPRQNRQSDIQGVVPSGPAENFAGTPYQNSPPEVQRDVVVSAQSILGERGLYHGPVNGMMGPDFEFSLRAYQARVRLPVTGRLDLDTLAALELLPGSHRPVYVPRRRQLPEAPVRGQWIPEPH
jgi:peptidoglycan hydrolase-like protein with peptidoglycan-binding domain